MTLTTSLITIPGRCKSLESVGTTTGISVGEKVCSGAKRDDPG